MISSSHVSVDHVASHYDELDDYYRDLWGEHVHHGLWETGREDTESATLQLAKLVAEKGLVQGKKVCDVGCGYGATSRLLAREYDARVTGLTVSERQLEFAKQATEGDANPGFSLQDWLTNEFPAESFDSVIAIESLAHMKDKTAFFNQSMRVLNPGGRLVVCAWMTSEQPTGWQTKRLLQPICDEGQLPGMGTANEYRALVNEAGFDLVEYQDLSKKVSKTWSICIRRGIGALCFQRSYRRLILDRERRNRIFGWTLFRIWAAYRTGCMKYGLFVCEKPAGVKA